MWIQPLFLTFQLMVVSVTIAAIVGIAGAWAASTLESAGRPALTLSRLFLATMVAAIAMPMILHAAAWEATAGKFGWLPLTQTGSRDSGLTAFGAFGGLTACGWIHGLVGASMVALATWHGVRTVPVAVIDQAQLESSPWRIWWRIRLPLALPWTVTALLATAALAATEMTVVDLYGFRTVADEFYLYFAVNPTSTSVVMTCLAPTIVGASLIGCVVSVRRQRLAVRRREEEVAHASQPPASSVIAIASGVVIAVSTLILFVPVMGLLVKVGHQVQVHGDEVQVRWSAQQAVSTLADAPAGFAGEYGWTLAVATLTGIVSIMMAWPCAAWARSNHIAERWIDFLSIVAVLIPGPIVGLVVVRVFQCDVPGFDALYQRTLIPTVIALLLRAGPLAYWVLRAGYRVIDSELLDASRLDGSPWRRMWSIDRHMLGTSFFVAFAGACVMASGDVPAALPVIPPGVTTVGTRLFGLLHSGARQQEAALAIWYLATVVLFAMIGLMRVQRRRDKRSRDGNHHKRT